MCAIISLLSRGRISREYRSCEYGALEFRLAVEFTVECHVGGDPCARPLFYLAEVRPCAGPSEPAPDADYRFIIHRRHYGFGHASAWFGGCHLGHGVPLASRPAR